MIERLRLVFLGLAVTCLSVSSIGAVDLTDQAVSTPQSVRLRVHLPSSSQTIEVTSEVDGGGATTIEEKGRWKIGLTITSQADGSGFAVHLVDILTLADGEEVRSIAETSPLELGTPLTFLRQGHRIELTLLKLLDALPFTPPPGEERIPVDRCCVTCGTTTACGCAVTMECGSCCAGGCCH